MLKPHYFILLVSLLADGGIVVPQPITPVPDAGIGSPQPTPSSMDGGTGITHPRMDAGASITQPITAESIHWPDELHPVATLDGPAVLAAHAALQHLLARLAKEYPKECAYSAKAMEVVVGEAEGLYFVRIDQHVDRCGWADPSFIANSHWWEMYAVTPDGRVLAREPYTP